MFAYCGNNPVNRADDGGEFWHIVIGAAVGAVVGFVSSVATDLFSGEDVDWWGAAISAGIGAVEGGLVAACPAYAVAISAATSATDTFINSTRDYVNKGEGSVEGIIVETAVSAGIGALTGKADGMAICFKQYGENVTKRVTSSFVHNGFDAAKKEAMKATKYYFSQTWKNFTRRYSKSAIKGLLDDIAIGTVRNYI